MEGNAVSLSVLFKVFCRDVDSLVQIVIRIGCNNGSHFFSAQSIGKPGTFRHDNYCLCIFRNLNACKLRDFLTGLSYRVAVGLSIFKESSSYFFQLFLIAYYIGSVVAEFFQLFQNPFRR